MTNPKSPKPNKSPLLDSLVAPVAANDMSLTIFARVADMPDDEPYLAIKNAYQHPALWVQTMGVLLNGVVHSRKPFFFISQTWLKKYWAADPNFKTRRSLKGTEFTEIINELLGRLGRDEVFLKEVSPPSNKGAVEFRSRICTISNPAFTSTIPWWSEECSKVSSTGFSTGPSTNNTRQNKTKQNKTFLSPVEEVQNQPWFMSEFRRLFRGKNFYDFSESGQKAVLHTIRWFKERELDPSFETWIQGRENLKGVHSSELAKKFSDWLYQLEGTNHG
ncbi:MAG: hypothetical protein AB7G93_10040 [Bdellovibrionales bacterium]